MFEGLRFKVEVKQDLTSEQLRDCLEAVSQRADLATHDCFVCFILTHGASRAVYGVDGLTVDLGELLGLFKQAQGAPLSPTNPRSSSCKHVRAK